MPLTAVDLFCGAGGLSLGLTRAGFEVLGAVDSWKPAVASYRHNFAHPVLCTDIAAMTAEDLWSGFGREPGPVDLVVGGPPCQGFSIQRIGPDADGRNSLVLEFGRLVADLSPRAFLMENVTGLTGRRGRELLTRLVADLTDCGYRVRHQVVDAVDYGVPQRRRRVIVYGWQASEPELVLDDVAPSDSPAVTVWDAIGDLPPAAPNGEAAADNLHVESRMSPLNRARLALIPPGGGFEDLPPDMRVDCHKVGASKIGHRNVYGRLDPDLPSVTITARFDSFTRGKFAHPTQDRNITLREGARLQSFPDNFAFEGNREEVAAQIGNAVPPKLAEALGVMLRQSLLGERAHQAPLRLL